MADEKLTKAEEKELAKQAAEVVEKVAETLPEVPVEVAAKPAVVMVATVHGDMVDPTTGERYTRVPRDLARPSGWVASQIEAKKMVVQ